MDIIEEYLKYLNEIDITSAAADVLSWGAANPVKAALAGAGGLAAGHVIGKAASKPIGNAHKLACAKRHRVGSPEYKQCMTKGLYGYGYKK
jgi:hypothetical protein